MHLVPKRHGVARIGHAGLFDEEHFERVWPMISEWLGARVGGSRVLRQAASAPR
jgi:hypothetical protein